MGTKKKKRLSEKEILRREIKRVRDRERRFKAMPPNRKRMAIARDVIAQIRLGKINPASGVWFDMSDLGGEYTGDTELQRVLVAEECTACAVGALFACTVLRNDDYTAADAGCDYEYDWENHVETDKVDAIDGMHFDKAASYMEDIFSNEELLKIECAFELGGSQHQHNHYWYRSARDFGLAFEYATGERMIAIMENIIRNDGTFDPNDLSPQPT